MPSVPPHRWLPVLAVSWLLGRWTAAWHHLPPLPLCAMAALMFGAFAALSPSSLVRIPRLARSLALLAAFLSALAPGTLRTPTPPPHIGRSVLQVEVLRSTPTSSASSSSCRVRVLRLRPLEAGAPTRPTGFEAQWHGCNAAPGSRWRLLGSLHPRFHPRNPSPAVTPEVFSRPSVRLRVEGAPKRLREAEEPTGWIHRLRIRVARALGRSLPARARSLALALALGSRGEMTRADREALHEAGLAHVLAVSGLHVALGSGWLWLLVASVLRRSRLARTHDPSRLAAWVVPPAACFQCAIAGFPDSAVRAAVMGGTAALLHAMGRRPSSWALLGAAVLVVGIADPEAASRPGLLLSASAVAGLLGTLRPPAPATFEATRRAAPQEPLRALLAAGARSTVATAPLLWLLFGSLPLAGLLANVLLLPVAAALLVPLALALAVAAALGLPLGPLCPLFAWLAEAFLSASTLLGTLWPAVRLPPPTPWQLLGAASTSIVLLSPWPWRRRTPLLLIAAAAVLLPEVALRLSTRTGDTLRVTFLDVGQGDATLLELPGGHRLLVDTGGLRRAPTRPAERSILPWLRTRRISRIEELWITHPHPDHDGGVLALAAPLGIRRIWSSRQAEHEQPEGPAARTLAALRRRGIRVRYPRAGCGRPRRLAGIVLRLLHPCPGYDPGLDPNDNSLVLHLRFGRRSLLLAGDLEALGETRLLREHGDALAAEVLKVPHHGSRTSSTRPFLEAVAPVLAVVSAGRDNPYGHPHAEALRRLHATGARIWRIDQRGGLTLWTDGHGPWHSEGADGSAATIQERRQ